MYKYILIILLLNSMVILGQSNAEHYKFLRDIYSAIDKDTTDFKYQLGANELSFSGYYMDVLKVWEKNGFGGSERPTFTREDSLLWLNSRKVDAKQYILSKSKEAEIVIINEAHHIPKHRIFTKSLLEGLYENGYRYLGLEALFDTIINERKYPVIESGIYTKEPEFGNLISEALALGFVLFGYETSKLMNAAEREKEQAENIQRFIENNPKGKVLIHCGYAHVYENEYGAWGKAMAGRLKDNLKTDPLTVNQTMFLEKSRESYNHLYIRNNDKGYPIILVGEDGEVFNGKKEPKQTDIVVIHPGTTYINGRPDWFIKGKHKHSVEYARTDNSQPVLILAYRDQEFENDGIPSDVIEVTGNSISQYLYLKGGMYEIIIKDQYYNIIEKYNITIR